MERVILAGCIILKEDSILLLYRSDHGHYETPGGKPNHGEFQDPQRPTIKELESVAKREAFEELGSTIVLSPLTYFGCVYFTLPNGRKGTAHKFMTSIVSGNPIINEPEKFSKLEYLPLQELEKYPISPDLHLLAEKVKAYVRGM